MDSGCCLCEGHWEEGSKEGRQALECGICLSWLGVTLSTWSPDTSTWGRWKPPPHPGGEAKVSGRGAVGREAASQIPAWDLVAHSQAYMRN